MTLGDFQTWIVSREDPILSKLYWARDMNDTPPEIAEMVRERLMERSGAERVLMGSRMFDAARTIILSSFPAGLSDIEIKGLLCKRLYGAEVDVEAFVAHLRAIEEPRPAV